MDKKETKDVVVQTPDWGKIQNWLQDAAMELAYLVLRVSAKRNGDRMPDQVPTIFALANDMSEPLTEESVKNRIKEISRLSETWATSDTFPQF